MKNKLQDLSDKQELLLSRRNIEISESNGIYNRYKYPILTNEHAPIIWRYDFHQQTKRYLMVRKGINVTLTAGTIKGTNK